jgi:cysteine-rich repeat protein
MLAGCDSLLDDLSGTLCNPDGSCPEGYHCAAATNRCERGPAPSPNPDGGGSDGGTQDGGTDAGVCSGVQACTNADGCCPAGCNANTDSDCQPVCGNGETEASGNEVCDDGNRLNGDNCDPTCRYFNVMSTLSGTPGSRSFADGTRDVARLHGPAGITADNERSAAGRFFYITDSNNSTVRQHRLGITSTLAGRSFFKQSVDGVGSDAGFAAPGDVAYVGGVLYIVDAPNTPGARLRRLDLDGGVVSTVDAGTPPVFSGLRGIAADRDTLLLVSDNGLQRFDPRSDAPPTQLVAPNRLQAAAGDTCFDVAAHPVNTDLYLLACNRSIVQATPSNGGLSVAAGSASSTGCTQGTITVPNSRFTRARSIDFGSSGNDHRIYVTDSACHTVVELTDVSSVVAGAFNEPGHVNSANPRLARFNGPTAIAALSVPDGGVPELHVADFDNAAYRTVSPTGTTTAAGSPPSTTLSYGGGGTAPRYTPVSALAVDGAAGLLYAYSPSSRRLFQVSLTSGTPEELMAFTANPLPLGLTVVQGTLYVSLNNKTIARLVRSPTPALQHFAGQANSTALSADGEVSSAILFASDMTTDGTDLFFHDLSAKTVRKIDLDEAPPLVRTIAGSAASGDGGSQSIIDGVGPSARFANPVDLTSDGTSLYLLDGPFPNTPRTVVRKVDPASRAVTTLAGEFSSQNAARDGTGLDARFAGAVRLTTDGRVLFISDPGGGYGLPDLTSPAIRMLDLSTLEVTTMVGTRGQWTLKNGTGTGAAINSPGPIVFDPERSSIYFFDFEEGVFQRIR